MKKFLTSLILFVVVFSSVAVKPGAVHADFDYTNLISDSDFTRWDALDANGINTFLNSKGSWMANYTIPEYIDVPYFCRDSNGNNVTQTVSVRQWHPSGYGLYGMTVASLLADRAKLFTLNPEVMIVLAERESNAVTKSSPSSQMTQAWPLFYGFDEIMASFGYNCSDARQKAIDFGGVGQQIAFGSYGIKNMYNNPPSSCQGTLTIDGTTFNPASNATWALYCYTPHIRPGNFNFWNLFTTWFGSVATPYNPTLVKSNGAIFIADQGQLWHINSADTFNAWGFSWSAPIDLAGSGHENDPLAGEVGRVIRTSWGRVFYMENGKKRPIMSPRIFTGLGFNWNDVVQVNDEIIKKIPTGIPMWELTRIDGTSVVYFQSRGQNHPIADASTFQDAWHFDWSEVADVPSYVVTQFPTTQPLTRLAMSNQGVVFFLDDGIKYQIPDPTTFNRYNFQWSKISAIENTVLDHYPTKGMLTALVSAPDGRVFYIDGGVKRYVSRSAFVSHNFSYGDIRPFSWVALNLIPNGSNL